jgi:hypothetical protein
MKDKHVVVDGHFISQRISQLVRALQDYCPELEVKWVPPALRDPGEAAFKIYHNPVGQQPYCITTVKTEDEFDERLLKKIIAGDQRSGEVRYTDFEAWETAQKLAEKQVWEDSLEEAHDLASALIRTDKSKYVINKDLMMTDYGIVRR